MASPSAYLNKKAVFDGVYRESWKSLYVFAFNILRDREAAEDILQEVFIDLWVRMSDVEIHNFKSYLYKAVRNQCAKKLSSKKLIPSEVEILERIIQYVEEEYLEFSKEELVLQVSQKAQEVLPERCHMVFKLRFYENLSLKEIAKEMEVSVKTVENQITKALKILKKENIHYLKLLLLLITSSRF